MPKVTEGVRRFLTAKQAGLPGADLLERYLRWGPENLETQINVASDGGDPVEGRRNTWTDGTCNWFHIRIPKNAYDKPEWDDYELRWAPEEHAEAIGSTGWDWKTLRSRWVGFDFDDITDHAKGVGVNEEELEQVREAAQALPYVEVRKSTGGRGIHLYVLFDEKGIPTATHTEHAALARCILGMMTAEVNFDFASAIDACGSNMWIWRRTITDSNEGLLLLKSSTKALGVDDLPANWRDHIEVVTRRANKVKLQGVADEHIDPFDELTSARRLVPLDDTHKATIEALMETGFSIIWVSDHHLLQGHTRALAKLMNDAQARSELGLVGHFQTNSPGNDPGNPNCFLFPMDGGGWRVYRFSPGVSEAETWVQDGAGWTTCYFNRLPDVDTACRAYGGLRAEGKQQYTFPNGHNAIKAAEALGQRLDIPAEIRDRTVEIRVNKGYLTVYLQKIKKDDGDRDMKGWIEKPRHWIRDLEKKVTKEDTSDLGEADYDGFLRSLRSPAGEVSGWMFQTAQGDWSSTGSSTVKTILQAKGQPKPEAEVIMGTCAVNPWKIVCQPFQDEYPGGRRWNQGAPQLRFAPAQPGDSPPVHPHWDLVLNHVGCELTPSLQKHRWAQRYGVLTGAQYLQLWIASIFQEPYRRNPYIFLHGNENSGKSIFYEAIQLLVTKGVVNAGRALTTTNDFNGELVGAILCYVEEIDLSHHKVALPRIKDWTMAEFIPIRQMRRDAYEQINTTHWIQVANFRDYCPIFGGDTRITAIQVPDLLDEQEIPKEKLKAYLQEEAPQFLCTLLNLTIPPTDGRLRIPVIETESKLDAIELNKSALEEFVELFCESAPGERVSHALFCDTFIKWLPDDVKKAWSIQRISQSLKWADRSRSKTQRFLENMILHSPTETRNDEQE